MTAGFAANTALIAAKWQRKFHMNLTILWKAYIFLQIWKKNQQKFWKRFATMMFFFAFGSPTLCQLLTKFHKIFQKRDHFFPKSCKVATHLAADTAAFAAQKQWKLLMNRCISKSFAFFLWIWKKINKCFEKQFASAVFILILNFTSSCKILPMFC